MENTHNRKFNIKGIVREVKRREREGKRALNLLNSISTEDLKSGAITNGILENRSLHYED